CWIDCRRGSSPPQLCSSHLRYGRGGTRALASRTTQAFPHPDELSQVAETGGAGRGHVTLTMTGSSLVTLSCHELRMLVVSPARRSHPVDLALSSDFS